MSNYEYRRIDDLHTGARADDLDRSWCADEVHVDFPAIPAGVGRIRAWLAGDERQAPVTASLRLSHREAFDGVTVPLDVPVRTACPICGGRGESWMETCRACRGTGDSLFHHRVRLSVPAGVADGARFSFSVSGPLAVPTRVEVVVQVA